MTAARFARYTRLMLVGAAVILIVTAVLHGAELPQLDRLISGLAVEHTRSAFPAVWLLYAVHLVLIAVILIYAASRPGAVTGPLLVLCGLVPAVDALVTLAFVGAFPGNALLGLAAVLVFGAVARGTTPITDDLSETSASREGP